MSMRLWPHSLPKSRLIAYTAYSSHVCPASGWRRCTLLFSHFESIHTFRMSSTNHRSLSPRWQKCYTFSIGGTSQSVRARIIAVHFHGARQWWNRLAHAIDDDALQSTADFVNNTRPCIMAMFVGEHTHVLMCWNQSCVLFYHARVYTFWFDLLKLYIYSPWNYVLST